MNVVTRFVLVIDVIAVGSIGSASSSLLPHGMSANAAIGLEEIGIREPFEFFQVSSSSKGLEGLNHDQVLTMLECGVMDVLNRLEERRQLAGHLPLLLSFVTK